MARHLAAVSLLVHDYDEAIAFFTRALRFTLLEDAPLGAGKRWVIVSPGPRGASLLIARASDDVQRAAVGRQAGGRVFLFLHSTDLDADVAHMQAHGVRFAETPRDEVYGRVVVFFDLCGNKWDLIQPKEPA